MKTHVMSIPKEMAKFKWLMMTLPPALGLAIHIIMFGHLDGLLFWEHMVSLLILVGTISLLSPVQVSIANFMRARQINERHLVKRITLAGCLHIPVTAALISVVVSLYSQFHLFGYQFRWTDYLWALLAGALADVVGISMSEGIYSYHRWKETTLLAEQLSKEKLQTQLDSLIQQVNPHFLFNSLNTLSALIHEDPAMAQKYLSELSKVYRYLLKTNDDMLTTLTLEMQFMDSYFHLLKMRFSEGICFSLDIDEIYLSYLIPPLTIQLLVENAVKHNSSSRSKPLNIHISVKDARVTVRNNLQRRSFTLEGGKVGLSNISSKYRLIGNLDILVQEVSTEFLVTVPLINPDARHL